MAFEVKESVNNVFFIMVGDGEERCKIEEMIESKGLKNSFIITGWVNNPLEYLNVMDVATLFSRWEGFGLVLPEYMLAGRPIVATKVDAIPYILGEAGILVDSEDYISAANYIIELKENKTLRNNLIALEKEQVKHFDAQRTADEHVLLFNKLV